MGVQSSLVSRERETETDRGAERQKRGGEEEVEEGESRWGTVF